MDLIVQKPQFDIGRLPVGTPIHINCDRGYDKYFRISKACLVKKIGPLGLKALFINEDGSQEELDIPVTEVASGKVEIRVMEVVGSER